MTLPSGKLAPGAAAVGEKRHLKNAPITEALVDVKVKARAEFNPEELRRVRELLAKDYPNVEEQRSFTAKLDLGGVQSTKQALWGFAFRSADRLDVAQYRVDGFTFNRLKPYQNWESMWLSAFTLWKTYVEVASPLAVTRMAVRYINHIDLPRSHRFEDVSTCPPPIPAGLSVVVNKYASKLTFSPKESEHLRAHVSQALEEKPGTDQAVFLLDIDAFRESNLFLQEPDVDQVIQATFAEIREFKNRIFFASLTENVLRGFE